MGRGLSDLQRYILRETARQGIIFRVHILAGYFRWPSDYRIPQGDPGACGDKTRYFSKHEIGQRRYEAGMASVSRAVSRLIQRGLLEEKRWAYHPGIGHELTVKGWEWLSVNTLT
jgi:hypothetical protein